MFWTNLCRKQYKKSHSWHIRGCGRRYRRRRLPLSIVWMNAFVHSLGVDNAAHPPPAPPQRSAAQCTGTVLSTFHLILRCVSPPLPCRLALRCWALLSVRWVHLPRPSSIRMSVCSRSVCGDGSVDRGDAAGDSPLPPPLAGRCPASVVWMLRRAGPAGPAGPQQQLLLLRSFRAARAACVISHPPHPSLHLP